MEISFVCPILRLLLMTSTFAISLAWEDWKIFSNMDSSHLNLKKN